MRSLPARPSSYPTLADACPPAPAGGLSASQNEHISSGFPSDENTLAELAGRGMTEGLRKKMAQSPEANPALAVSWAAENGRLECLALALSAFDPADHHPMAAILAIQNGHLDCLRLLAPSAPPGAARADLLRCAAAHGRDGCLGFLLGLPQWGADASCPDSSDPYVAASMDALQWAAHSGWLSCVRLLLPFCDPAAGDSLALREAAQRGRADCVEALVDLCDPRAFGSEALRDAAWNGHADCVRALLPRSDPMADGCVALASAAEGGHLECVELLLAATPDLQGRRKALALAAQCGHAPCALALLPACALRSEDSDASEAGAAALRAAVEGGAGQQGDDDYDDHGEESALAIVEALLAAGAKTIASDPVAGFAELAEARHLHWLAPRLLVARERELVALAAAAAEPNPAARPRL